MPKISNYTDLLFHTLFLVEIYNLYLDLLDDSLRLQGVEFILKMYDWAFLITQSVSDSNGNQNKLYMSYAYF